ncbi:MAG: metallophosphoesterase family protein [Candidatus Promineifilaceae bacterium]
MKIAVLSDVHGNFPALEAVVRDVDSWHPDQVVVNGDIVNRGPCSHTCLDYLLARRAADDWQILKGNHEEYLLYCASPDFRTDEPAFEINRFAYWAYQQLNGRVAELASLPDRFTWLAPDESEFRVTHASMRSSREGLYEEQSDAALERRISPAPAVFVTGHTHQAFIRQMPHTLVVNAGSAGAPFDLDWRPSYGRFTWDARQGWQATIRRVEYDRRLIERDYVRSGFLEEGGALAQLMLLELRKSRGLLFRWAEQYEAAVLNGDLTLAESVRRVMREDDVRPFVGSPGWTLPFKKNGETVH